ncbi:MAG: hypothetical protein NW203_15635 [Hyphomonadaceae bacterium]|nr:hypothetical protein [Hyphomonadaceae bacterium]
MGISRWAVVAVAAALGGCEQEAAAPRADIGSGGPQLEAPAPESAPARRFMPQSDAARAATGALIVTETVRIAQSAEDRGGEVLTLRAENGLVVEARLAGAAPPSTRIGEQTLRALMELPVEASQTLLYAVSQEGGGASLCDAGPASHIVLWESETPGDAGLRVLPFTGGAPADADAAACTLLAYARAEGG